jgi:WD40 repeat protein
MIGELAARTVGAGMLAVVGPSGSGKSSVVLAGLLPSLAARILPGSDRWRATVVRPGDDPMAALGSSLDADGGERIILVVDQFEELFTGTASDEDRAGFVDALTTAAADPERACVVLTIRADYYGHCAAYPRLAELLAANQVLVGPMAADELARAIEMPARRSGLFVERALTEALVAEVVDEPGGLPLLSTALVELWQGREDGWLRLRTYEQTGGVHGAVARLAEESFGRLEGEQREAARAILLRLVGEGEGDTAVRRRVPLTEFDHTSAVDAVLARFTADRLLTADDGNVEVAHEALIREWPRLRAWLDEDAQGRQLRAHVTQAAKQWNARERDPAELYRGSRLSVTLDWSARHGRELNDLEREFLSKSREASERDAVRQRRTNRRLRGLLVGVAVFLVVALVAGALALVQRGNAKRSASRAERSARVALSQSLGAQAVIDPQLDQAMLLAREGLHLSVNERTRSFLLSTLQGKPLPTASYHVPEGNRPVALALSPDGRTLAVGENSDDLVFRDTATGSTQTKPIAGGVGGLAYTPDGSELAVVRVDHGLVQSVDLLDAASHAVTKSLPVSPGITNTAFSIALGFSPDGKTMAVGSDSSPPALGGGPQRGYAMQFDLASGRQAGPTIAVPGGVAAVGYADHGSTLVTVGAKTTKFDAASGRLLGKARAFGNPAGPTAAISPDGRLAAAQDATGLQVLDLGTGTVSTLSTDQIPTVPMLFAPDGRTLVTGSDDHLVRVWDVVSHSLRETLAAHGGPVHQLAISGDGLTLYSGGLDGAVFTWDLTAARGFGDESHVSTGDSGNFGPTPNVSVSPDGAVFATGETDGTVVLADATTLQPIRSFHAMDLQISAVSFGPDGTTLAVAGGLWVGPKGGFPIRGETQLWSVGPHPTLIRTLRGLDWASWLTFTPDGRRVVAGGGDNTGSGTTASGVARVAEWDAVTGRLVAPPVKVPTASVLTVASNDDGTLVAAGLVNDKTVLVDPVHGRVVRTLALGGGTVAVAPDGRTLAAGDGGGFVHLVRVSTGRAIGAPLKAADGFVSGVGFDPTGRTLLVVGGDASVRLYDVGTWRELGIPFVNGSTAAGYGVFTPDDRILVMFDDGEGAFWPVTLGAWEAKACAVAGRPTFTRGEWAQFVGPAYPHARVCT